MAIEELYEFNDVEESGNGKPQWFKIWADKYADALDIENLDADLTQNEKEILFREVGKAFISSLFYFRAGGKNYDYYKPATRDGKILWNALKRDIDMSFRDYAKRVENGKRSGGRPPKKTE